MSDLDLVMQAFDKAQTQGNTEAAKDFAKMALDLDAQFAPAPTFEREVGLGEAFGIGLERGVGRFGSTITDIIPALAGSAVGADEYAQRQLEEAAVKEAALPAPVFESYKDVGGVGDAAKFVLETVGEQVPNLGMALGTALTGGAAAPALLGGRALATKAATEAAKREAAKLVAKQSAAGQFAGAAFGSYALNAPEVFQNIYQETGEFAPGTALLFGAAAASLDSILPAAIARNISAPVKAEATRKLLLRSGMKPSVLRSAGVGLAKGLGLEGVTEGAQEAISIAAERLIDDNPDIFGSKEFDRIMESAVRGAVAGGAFGGTGGGVQGAREKAARAERLADLNESRKLRDEFNKKAAAEAGLVANIEEAQAQPEQGDLFGAPIATTLVPPARPEGEPEVTPSVARFMEGRPEPKTPIAKFTDAEVKVEAKRRSKANKTEESVEFANVWREVKEARAAEATALSNQIKRQTEMFSAKGNLTKAVASQNTAFNALEKKARAAQKKLDAAAAKAAKAAEEAKKKAVLKQDQTAFSFEPSAEETANLAAEREAAVISEAESIVETRYADARNKAGDALNLPRPTADVIAAEVAAEAEIIRNRAPAEEARQGDVLTGQLPGEQTRAPLVGTDLNKFLRERSIPVNAATKQALAGRDLAIPEQREAAISALTEVAEKSKSGKNIDAIETFLRELDPARPAPAPAADATTTTTTTTTTETTATEPKPKTKTKPAETEIDNTGDDIPQQSVQFFPNSKITDIGIKQLAISQTKNLRKPKALRDSGITEAFNWFMNEDNANVTDAHLAAYQRAVDTYQMNAPVYKGAAFSPEISRLASNGRFAPLLNKLIPSQPVEIQRILRKIGTQNLKTKIVVGATPEGTSGFYDAETNVITLDPVTGMNEHTFLHEGGHASLVQALGNPDLQITKDFFEFFSAIKSQMGDAYGGQNLQEFAAELVGNPEFQALLKQIKAPESKTMWQTIMDAIANFFGFRKGQSAYTKGLDFIDQILDVSQGVEPTVQDKFFLGTPKMAMDATAEIFTSAPAFVGKKVDNLANAMSKIYRSDGGGTLTARVLSAFRLQDFIKMTAKKFPAFSEMVRTLQDIIMKRQGARDKKLEEVKKVYRELEKTQKAFPEEMLKLNKIAQEAKRRGFDFLKIDKQFDRNALTAEQKRQFATLEGQLKNLPTEVQEAYSVIRKTLRKDWVNYKKLVLSRAENKVQKTALETLFKEKAPLIGYVPSKRFGDYYLEYTDASGERVATSFESPRQRQQFEDANKADIKGDVKRSDKLEKITYSSSDHPPDSLIRRMMESVPPEYRDEIYQAHLSFMPKESILQNTLKYEGVKGESQDLVRGWVDTATRVANKLNALEYAPQIELAMGEIDSSDPGGFAGEVRNAIIKRKDFIANPTYPKLTGVFATGAYGLFLLGNASSALINTSAILLLTYPMLISRYGFNDANTVLLSAMQEALPSFLPKAKQKDGLIEYKWQANPKYKVLLDALNDRGQLQHTLSREILEGARKDTVDYNSKAAKAMNLLSVPFSGAEKYSRATSALATFNLAKKKGKSDAEAAAEAVNLVIDVHTTGMAAEGPSLMQHPVGRVMFTFKSFIWNSASVIGMGFYDSVANVPGPERTQARKQLLGIYATSAALGGINGLPFFGAAATFANILEAMNPFDDDDEPFNAKEEIRAATNEFFYKGPFNYLTNIEFSNRIGLANGMLFREDPYSIEQNGYVLTAIMQGMGPVGSYFLGAGRAMESLADGEYLRFWEGISPSAARNLFKTARYYKEGVRTRSGEELDTDLSGWTLFMQAFGFSPADVSSLYENRSISLNFQAKQLDRLAAIKKKYYVGVENGDAELMLEANEKLMDLMLEFPGIADGKTLQRSYKAKKVYERDLVLGLRINPGLRDAVNERFLDEFIA
jgi:hypothetical protein